MVAPAPGTAEIQESVHEGKVVAGRAMGRWGGVVKVEVVEKGYYAGRAEVVPEVRVEVWGGE